MIGIFDSGVGGLTVAREIKKRFPKTPILYFGDTARMPWGSKSPETVRRYAGEICDFLVSKGVKKIVIACNTASAFAGSFLRERYPDMEIYDVIGPVVEKIVRENGNRKEKIGIIGTRGTISSGIYERKIRDGISGVEIYSQACPLFAPLVEEGWSESEVARVVVEKYLREMKEEGISKIILGCTHYPLLEGVIRDFLGSGVECVSSSEEVAESMVKTGGMREDGGIGKDKFYFSDFSENFLELAENIYGARIDAEKIDC